MGGIPAGGAGSPPPAGSSSAVKSIVAACSVLASCCSITATRARHDGVGCSAQSCAMALLWWGVRALLPHATQGHRAPLTTRNGGQRQRGAKPSCTQPCCPLRFAGCPHCWESKEQQSASAERGLARVHRYSALQSTLEHALPWHNNATRPARSPASAAAEIHTRAARHRRAI